MDNYNNNFQNVQVDRSNEYHTLNNRLKTILKAKLKRKHKHFLTIWQCTASALTKIIPPLAAFLNESPHVNQLLVYFGLKSQNNTFKLYAKSFDHNFRAYL